MTPVYYTIDNRVDDEEVGSVYPQASCLTQADAHQLRADRLPAGAPRLAFELQRKARLTDLLSEAAMNARGLLMSAHMKEAVAGFTLMRHRFCPASVDTPEGGRDYFWLHLSDPSLEKDIDFPGSAFSWTQSTFREGPLQLSSYEDYLQKREENGFLWGAALDRIKLLDRFDRTLDLFTLGRFDGNIYISEALRAAIVEAGCTGVEIRKAENFA